MINKVFVYLWNDVYHIYPDKAITRFYFHLVLVLHFNLFFSKTDTMDKAFFTETSSE